MFSVERRTRDGMGASGGVKALVRSSLLLMLDLLAGL